MNGRAFDNKLDMSSKAQFVPAANLCPQGEPDAYLVREVSAEPFGALGCLVVDSLVHGRSFGGVLRLFFDGLSRGRASFTVRLRRYRASPAHG